MPQKPQQKEDQYAKMTRTPVSRLVLGLAVPTTVSMLVTNIYNLVDTWFVGRLGTSASGATGVVFALMAIIQATGFMFGHGAGSNISRLLGARHVERARVFSATSFYLSIALGLLITAGGLCFLDPLCRLLGSTPTILPYARTYAACILLAAPAMASSCVMNNILRYEGHASFAMVGLTLGGVVNMGLDALFMMGFGMGIGGAALATMLSQYLSWAVLLSMFLRGKTQSSFAPRYFTRSPADVLNILFTGLPSMTRQGLNSISTMILNLLAGSWGDAAVAAMGIVGRITSFLFSVGLGIWQGFQPVSSFNYGAKRYSRVRAAFRFTLVFCTGVLAAFGLAGILFAPQLIATFRDDPEVIAIGTVALRAHCSTLFTLSLSACGNMLFQSTGFPGQATFLSCLRSGLLYLPVLLAARLSLGLLGIQIAQPIADLLATAVTIPFVVRFFRRLPADMPERT